MAGGIEVHPERVACRLAWLHCVLRCSERKHLGLDRVDIVDGHIEMELLRSLARRPRRRRELLGLLERQSQPIAREHDPVILDRGDFPAQETSIEHSKCPRIGAIQDHGAHPGECHGQTVSHGPVAVGRPLRAE